MPGLKQWLARSLKTRNSCFPILKIKTDSATIFEHTPMQHAREHRPSQVLSTRPFELGAARNNYT